MDKNVRIQKIKELKPTSEKKLIFFNDKKDLFDVYEVPMEFLVYNQYNGRIKAMSKSWENANQKLNSEIKDDVKIIEQFLWDSAPNKNEQTKQSIKEYGQFEVGMITEDGVIIDGNRRASIINILNREEKDLNKHLKFRTIILPTESLKFGNQKDKEREIIKLETIYQMGVDAKVDYNPIEKYLRCKELIDLKFSRIEIANMLSVNQSVISKMQEIFILMEKYLNKFSYNGVYIGLDKREGHFVDLRNYLASYDRGVGRDYAKWNYSVSDLEDMTNIYFDFARLRYPVQNCRIIANPSKSQSFFCHEEVWTSFQSNHSEIISEISENEFDIFSERIKEKKINNIIADRDELWSRSVKSDLIDNLFTYKRKLEDSIKLNIPFKKLVSAKNTIHSIDLNDINSKKDSDIDLISDEIIKSVEKIKEANNN